VSTRWDQQQIAPPPTVMAFVDAGYLTAGARAHLKLPSAPRIDGDKLVTLAEFVLRGPRGGDLIRVYVYDAQYPGDAPEYPDQRAYFDTLGEQSGIRLRLGHLVKRAAGTPRAAWQQKGVDTLLVLDLVRMAQLRAFDIALIIAGDRDLAEAARVIADDHARRVFLFSVEGSPPAKELLHAADGHAVLQHPWLHMVVGQQRPLTPVQPPAAGDAKAPSQEGS
jgi:uncharacterized LabA/DUF88 family protein